MHKTANVCVDAGMIMVGDLGYLDTVDKKADPGSRNLGRVFDIENGVHDVKWRIKKSWTGSIFCQPMIKQSKIIDDQIQEREITCVE